MPGPAVRRMCLWSGVGRRCPPYACFADGAVM